MTETVLEAHRAKPEISPWNKPFWTGGKDGELRLPKCDSCGGFLHPSQTVCPRCHEAALTWVAVSGKATVVGVTMNHQMFMPSFNPPYVIAVVIIDEAPHVRLTTNLVDVGEDEIRVG